LIGTLLQLAPEVPERGSSIEVRTTAQRLARSALAWLDHVPSSQPDEERTIARLRRQLQELAEEEADEISFAGALATLRQALADLRAWTDSSPEHQPWSSAGGHLHLTDLVHAGMSGRPRVFFLGMDADRVGAGRSQDPLLPDVLRRAVGAGRLVTSEERRAEREWLVARALAGSHGRVTLSWAMAADLTGRRAGPAAVVLDAMRLVTGNPQLSYEELRDRSGVPACAVPEEGRMPLDGRDAWLAALADGPLLLDGTATVRQAWPHLADSGPGVGALTAAGAVVLTGSEAPAVSASSLELLSKCPLAWFYRHLLGVEAPDDQEYDPDRWLDAAQRGLLLHELFELAGHRFQERQRTLDAATVRTEMLELTESVLATWSEQVPPPSQAVFESEQADLRQCALAFLDLERQAAAERHAAVWHLFEHWIGGPRAEFLLPDGSRIALKGRVDRVDRLPDGRLRVVDYKTGQAERFRPSSKAAPLAGGRLLQPALYAAAVSGLHDGAPTDFEYRFPTPRGRGARISYDAGMLREAGPVVATLLEHLAAGSFVATDDKEDCRFCAYQAVCRVRLTPYGGVEASPRAALAGERAPTDPAFAPMRMRRTRRDR
jgi:ATP-dependent helicase/nuclease subunit B